MSDMNGRVGMRGNLQIRVIRAHPTLRQRIADAIATFLRRFDL